MHQADGAGRNIASTVRHAPHGPSEPYNPDESLLDWLRRAFDTYGDVFQASIYGQNAYVVSRPDYANHVLRTHWRNYEKGLAIKRVGLLLGNGLMVSNGSLWQAQRRMMQPLFDRSAAKNFAELIIGANVTLLQSWEQAATQNKEVNATRDVSDIVLTLILKQIFGEDYDLVAEPFSILCNASVRDLQFAVSFRNLRQLTASVIKSRLEEKVVANDLLGALMQIKERSSGEPMSEGQLVSEVLTLIVAGHETTASTLSFCWYLLATHPAADEALAAELDEQLGSDAFCTDHIPKLKYTGWVIEEVLRLYPPGWLLTRRSIQDDQLGDYYLPAGTEVYISPYLIQRHPGIWDMPNDFVPSRWATESTRNIRSLSMLAFSEGPRNCIGEQFARFELIAHLAIIAHRLQMRCDHHRDLELEAGVNLRSKMDLLMLPRIRSRPHASH